MFIILLLLDITVMILEKISTGDKKYYDISCEYTKKTLKFYIFICRKHFFCSYEGLSCEIIIDHIEERHKDEVVDCFSKVNGFSCDCVLCVQYFYAKLLSY